MIHSLKISPLYFQAVIQEKKKFEVRFDDRNYKNGDVLHLMEFGIDGYTGQSVKAIVTFVLRGTEMLSSRYCVLSIDLIKDKKVR